MARKAELMHFLSAVRPARPQTAKLETGKRWATAFLQPAASPPAIDWLAQLGSAHTLDRDQQLESRRLTHPRRAQRPAPPPGARRASPSPAP
jgi:hypothetical protein